MATVKNRYVILLVGFFIALLLGILYAWSVFVLPLEEAFGWQRPETSFTFTLLMAFFCLGMFTAGKVIARIGAARTAFLGGVLGGVGFFAASYTTSLVWLYVSYGVIAGYGIGLTNIVLTSVILRWFPDKRGMAGGILTSGLALGAFLLGAKTAPYFISEIGWQGTFKSIGIAYWVFICSLSLLMNYPKEPVADASASPAAAEKLWGFSLKQMMASFSAWAVIFWLMFIHTGGLMVIGHIAPYGVSLGLSREEAAFVMGIFALANAAGRFLFGFMYDKLGRKPAMTLNSLAIAVGLLCLALLPLKIGYAGVMIGAILSGLAYGGSIPQLAATVSAFFGPRNFPTNYGFAALASLVAALLGPYLGSLVMQSSGYQEAILLGAGVSGISIVAALCLRQPRPLPEA